MYRVLLERAAEKDLSRLTSEIHDRVIAAIRGLATNPHPPGCRKLVGSKNDFVAVLAMATIAALSGALSEGQAATTAARSGSSGFSICARICDLVRSQNGDTIRAA
jgi:hypothetical protein